MRKADLNPKSEIRNPQSKGFTLLEVMVAVAILGMVLVTLLGVKNRSMQDVMLADHITTATLLAKRKMNENLVTAGSRTVFQQEDEGEFPDEAFKEYTWKQSISQLQPLGDVTITEVRVAVLWKVGERQEMVELLSYE
ncbi:MAG: prepilin-type N-terminal cleavage/methylation domain-containing protein [Nitrospirota bacterium]